MPEDRREQVDHPRHYGGADNPWGWPAKELKVLLGAAPIEIEMEAA